MGNRCLIHHLLTRHYDPSKYVNQHLDLENRILTVMLSNLSGKFVGFQQYRPDVQAKRHNHPTEARYFTYSLKETTAVWGLETLDRAKKELYVVEGIFKASSLHMLGRNAIAVLTSNPKPMKEWLHLLPYRLIGIGDNDKAGKSIVNICKNGYCLEKDIDEYSLEELEEVLNAQHC